MSETKEKSDIESQSVETENEKKSKIGVFRIIKKFAVRTIDNLYKLLSGKKRLFVFLGIWSLFLNYILESSLRKSLISGFTHIFGQPLVFLFNAMVIFASFSIILFVRRRMFCFLIESALWIAIAGINTNLLARRNTPFNGADFRVVFSAFEIIGAYLSVIEIILMVVLVLAVIALIAWVYIKGKKSPRNMYFSGVSFAVIISLTVGSFLVFTRYAETNHFSNLPTAYNLYGFAYSFLSSAVDHGIEKPKGYDDELVKEVLKQLDDREAAKEENETIIEIAPETEGLEKQPEEPFIPKGIPASVEKPNVIFIQLESFYDPQNIDGLTFDRDPMPIFRRLMEENMSGKFTVPSIGAGTCNTEFEVITGMDIDHFGIAEYPYLSVLQRNTCESIAYNFKEYGYAAHVLHNHTGTFYDRHIVFPNLGFDTFVSIENMGPVTRNETGWAKDSMLAEEIMDVMAYTPGQADLVYTISVQAHGKYPETPEDFEKRYNEENPAHVTVTGNEDSFQKPGVDYWVNQIYDVDLFIGDLIRELSVYEEPTILIMYGDHLPAFEVEEWTLKDGNYYQTNYVIWNNFGLEDKGDKDLYTFQIASYVMDMIGIDTGYMNMLHREMAAAGKEFSDLSDYSNEMQILQYDVLYGEKYAYGGNTRYLPANIKLGYKDIVIEDVVLQGDTLYIYGIGFNDRYSCICINGSRKDTTYLKEGCVTADGVILNDGDIIKVVQGKKERFPMHESNHWIYEE